jgi:hypothetical protein
VGEATVKIGDSVGDLLRGPDFNYVSNCGFPTGPRHVFSNEEKGGAFGRYEKEPVLGGPGKIEEVYPLDNQEGVHVRFLQSALNAGNAVVDFRCGYFKYIGHGSTISNSHFGKIGMWERFSAAKGRGKMPLAQDVDAGSAS